MAKVWIRRFARAGAGAALLPVGVMVAGGSHSAAAAPAGGADSPEAYGQLAPGSGSAPGGVGPAAVAVAHRPTPAPLHSRDPRAVAAAKQKDGSGATPTSPTGGSPTSGSPTPAAAALTARVAAGAYQLSSLDAQEAALGSDQALTPPDTQVAAGDGYLVEMDNASVSIRSSATGSLVGSGYRDLNSFFLVPSADAGYGAFDPRVLYDAGSGRWMATIGASDPSFTDNQVKLAVSETSDPTQPWWVFTVSSDTNGVFHDQPKLGVTGDKVVLTWDDYSNQATTFSGSEMWVLEKSTLLTGGGAGFYRFGPSATRYALVPAQVQAPGQVEPDADYVVFNNADPAGTLQTKGHPTLGVLTVTGTPGASNVTVAESDPGIPKTSVPPSAAQPGGGVPIETNDDRFLSAVWQRGLLWTGGNDSCTPPGTSQKRSCLRLVELSTLGTSPKVVQSMDVSRTGTDLYYPAVALDPLSDVFVAYTASSGSLPASAQASYRQVGKTGALSGPVTVAAGQGVYCGLDCAGGSATNRWGDYSSAAADPVSGDVWVAGEYAATATATATDPADWGTAAAALSLSPATQPVPTPAG